MEQNIIDFFDDEFPSFAVYNIYRMIGSYIDGLKPSSRKVVFSIGNHEKRIKVAQLCSEVAQRTLYIHGENNLAGVIVNMARNYTGANQMAVLEPLGSFGNRCIPESAAPRYIYTAKSDNYEKLFAKDDYPLLPVQYFEGQKIEPLFFVPTLPLILVNGSEGVGSGWSQKILQRDVKEIKRVIKGFLNTGKLPKSIKPSFVGYSGKIEQEENGSWCFYGKFERESQTKLRITELPISYTLDKYHRILTDLEDKRIISTFKDLSDPKTDKFEFVITARRDFIKQTDEKLFAQLKLCSRIRENFTCVDENNTVREFKSEIEILKAFIEIRIEYYEKRKLFLINKINSETLFAKSRARFVESIINGKLKIFKRQKKDVIADLKKLSFEEIDGNFNYLLNMPVHSFTTETLGDLVNKLIKLKNELTKIEAKDSKDFWLEDLK